MRYLLTTLTQKYTMGHLWSDNLKRKKGFELVDSEIAPSKESHLLLQMSTMKQRQARSKTSRILTTKAMKTPAILSSKALSCQWWSIRTQEAHSRIEEVWNKRKFLVFIQPRISSKWQSLSRSSSMREKNKGKKQKRKIKMKPHFLRRLSTQLSRDRFQRQSNRLAYLIKFNKRTNEEERRRSGTAWWWHLPTRDRLAFRIVTIKRPGKKLIKKEKNLCSKPNPFRGTAQLICSRNRTKKTWSDARKRYPGWLNKALHFRSYRLEWRRTRCKRKPRSWERAAITSGQRNRWRRERWRILQTSKDCKKQYKRNLKGKSWTRSRRSPLVLIFTQERKRSLRSTMQRVQLQNRQIELARSKSILWRQRGE